MNEMYLLEIPENKIPKIEEMVKIGTIVNGHYPVKSIRSAFHITQERLARELQCERTNIYNMEQKRRIKKKDLLAICLAVYIIANEQLDRVLKESR